MLELNDLSIQTLLINTKSLFLIINQELDIVRESPHHRKIWTDSLLQKNILQFIPLTQEQLKDSNPHQKNTILLNKSLFQYHISPITYQNQKHFLITLAQADEFTQKDQEEYLFLQTIMNYLPDLVLKVDKDGNYLDVIIGINHGFYKSRREIIGKNVRDIAAPENVEISLKSIKDAIAKQKLVEFEYSSSQTGTLNHYKASVVPYTQQAVGVIVQNQTKEVQILEKLRASERRFQAIFENSQDAIFLVLCNSLEIISTNYQGTKFFGKTIKNEVLRKTFMDFHQHLETEEKRILEKRLRQQESIIKEYYYQDRQGNSIWGNFSANPIRIGEDAYQLIRIANVTDAKKLEIRLRESQQALSESRDRFRLALESSAMGTWDINLKTNEMFWDERTYELFDEIPYQNNPRNTYDKKVHKEDWINIRRETDFQIKNNGTHFNFELRVVLEEIKYLKVSAKIYRNHRGYAEKIIGLCWDITPQKLNEIQLIEAKEQALELAKTKSQFLSVMTHEIRNSLNAMIGITQILLNEKSLPVQVKPLEALKFSADQLLLLINDILDFNKIEAGRIVIEQTDFNIFELLKGIEQVFSFLANQKNIKLSIVFDNRIPHWLIGDPAKLSQIITNLVGNAIKFTHKGNVDIEARFLSQDDEKVNILLAVSDTGIGIAQDKKNMIFEKFTQAEKDISRKYGGTGLGLAITKRLVELFDTEIKVQSEVGKGSRFYFEIEFRKSDKAFFEVKDLEVDETPKDLHKARILIAEDNHVNQLVIIQFLNRWNTLLDVVEDGKQALEKAQQNRYQLILLDLQMPVMNGFQAAKAIRQIDDYYKNLPILALSAEDYQEIKAELEAYEISDVIPKPYTSKELYEKIYKYLHLQEQIPESDFVFEINAQINLDNVRKIANNPAVLQHFIELNHKAFTEYNQFFEKALLENDWEEMRRITHKITSTIKFLCVDELLEVVMRGREIVKNNLQVADEKTLLIQKSRHLSQWILKRLESLKD